MKQYVYTLSVRSCFCILVNTSCMFILNLFKAPIYVNEIILSFLMSIQYLFLIGHTNADIGPWWLGLN